MVDFHSINWLAVLVAGIVAFMLGGVWYSPALLGNAWMKENKLTLEMVQGANKGRLFGWYFLLSLVIATNLALFLAPSPAACPSGCAHTIDLAGGALAGLLTGVWVFSFLAIIALFEQKTARYIFINGGYCMLALTLMGAIIGAWR
ncbi:MAG: DUF1761 domain-containing protein [Candidatus Pseudobacter hemicellulosilyticus]|uniref:DUF1761 domain-containing protein n=1 Tax=Candidatus Pseudobacter hemicellulosilyticus TaxID=3121375 RepID=A0AAJ5WTM6_9BACT|nr:MAG: DUF1761 domain-containing protein [Pseudobacter sp.]